MITIKNKKIIGKSAYIKYIYNKSYIHKSAYVLRQVFNSVAPPKI